MAPRKAELLDLMRKQRAAEKQGSAERTGSGSKAQDQRPSEKAPEPVRVRQRPSRTDRASRPAAAARRGPAGHPAGNSARLPWTGIGLVLLIAIPLVYWLSGVFGDDGLEGASGPADPGAGTGTTPPVAVAQDYGVVAVQYDLNAKNLQTAKEHGLRLMGLLQTSCDLYEVPEDRKIRIYLGQATSAADPGLLDLRERLSRLEYPAGSGKRPFATAYIDRCPVVTD